MTPSVNYVTLDSLSCMSLMFCNRHEFNGNSVSEETCFYTVPGSFKK